MCHLFRDFSACCRPVLLVVVSPLPTFYSPPTFPQLLMPIYVFFLFVFFLMSCHFKSKSGPKLMNTSEVSLEDNGWTVLFDGTTNLMVDST